jgi:hypothetical protein
MSERASSKARLGCGNDRDETIAEACKAKRTLPRSTQGNEPFHGEIRSKVLTVWREIEAATIEGTRLMKRADPTAGQSSRRRSIRLAQARGSLRAATEWDGG